MKNKFDSMYLIAPKNTALHSPCTEVWDIDEEVREFIPYLIRTMRREDGVGITANQVGINKAVIVTNIPGDHIRIYINPALKETWGMDVESKEGCLTFPGKLLTAQRKRHAKVHALNLKGEQFIVDTSSDVYPPKVSLFLSVCLQHEMDHINGRDMRCYM